MHRRMTVVAASVLALLGLGTPGEVEASPAVPGRATAGEPGVLFSGPALTAPSDLAAKPVPVPAKAAKRYVAVDPLAVQTAFVAPGRAPAPAAPDSTCAALPAADTTVELLDGQRTSLTGVEARRCTLRAAVGDASIGKGGAVEVTEWIGQRRDGRTVMASAALTIVRYPSGETQLVGAVHEGASHYVVQPTAKSGTSVVFRSADPQVVEPELPAMVAKAPAVDEGAVATVTPGADAGTADRTAQLGAPNEHATHTVRVAFVYVNGVTSSQAILHAAVSINLANEAFVNSGMSVRVEQADSPAYASYTQTVDMGTDLGRFAGVGDGYLESVHALRTARSADLASLVLPGPSLGACEGIAYVPPSVEGHAAWGFSAMNMFGCDNGVFVHEVGHNLGSWHDPANSHEPGDPLPNHPFTYSYGHYVNGKARDVMSYDTPCTAGCPGTAQFADPDDDFIGFPGVPSGTATRDADRSIDQTSWAVSAYYPATSNDYIWFNDTARGHVTDTVNDADGADVAAPYDALSGDFNGPAFAPASVDDVFWYYRDNGPEHVWYFNQSPSGTYSASSPPGVQGTYRPVTGDFDGDDIDDVFWHGPGGAPDLVWWGQWWTPNFGAAGHTSGFTVSGSYQPVAGDFDGDGRDDIFWQSPTGADSIWWGTADPAAFGTVSSSVSIAGDLVGLSGDFDGDGHEDITWYAEGTAADVIWWGQSSRSSFGLAANQSSRIISGFYLPGSGDFDGDGKDDIIWYGVGAASDNVWWGNGTRGSFGPATSTGTSIGGTYHPPVVGDFDGSGTDDVYWFALG